MANLTAEQQYYSAYQMLQEQIEALKNKLAEGKQEIERKQQEIGDKINYAHVGDLLHVTNEINQVIEFLG